MKLKIRIKALIVILIILPVCLPGQNSKYDRNDLIEAAKEIMNAVPSCAFITIDDKGIPRVRAMETIVPDSDMTVWFVTNPKSRKVQQVKKNNKVTLYYLNADNSGYVTIHGTAFLVDELNEKKKRWKEQWSQHYPNKYDDCLLIKIVPQWMEVLNIGRGIVGDSVTWQPPCVDF